MVAAGFLVGNASENLPGLGTRVPSACVSWYWELTLRDRGGLEEGRGTPGGLQEGGKQGGPLGAV